MTATHGEVNNSFKILTHNVQCLTNKIDMLNIFLSNGNNKFHVLALNEHWMSEEQIKHVNILGYTLVSSFCRDKGNHGGVCILIEKSRS